MSRRTSALLLVTCLVWVGLVDRHVAEAQTVAVLSRDSAGQAVVDLANVALSKNDNVSVVERDRVSSVLREQSLTAFGAPSDSVSLGHMLGVDLFAIWIAENSEMASGRLIVFDGKTGVRVGDTEIMEPDVERVSQRIADQVLMSMRKRDRIDNSGLTLVSFSSQRNIDLPLAWQSMQEKIATELQRSFAQSPAIGLLERERLRFVVSEGMLPIVQRQGRLLSTAQLITVQLSKSKSDSNRIGIDLVIDRIGSGKQGKISTSVAFDASSGELQVAGDELADAVVKFAAEQAKDAGSQNPTESEWAKLKADGLRHAKIREPCFAAIRLEAAYALNQDVDTLQELMLAIHRCLLSQTRSHVMRPRGQFDRNAGQITSDLWREVAKLAEYHLSLREQLHTLLMQKPHWPFDDSPNASPGKLSKDFSFLHNVGSNIQGLNKQRHRQVHQIFQDYYQQVHETVYGRFAHDAEERLTGEELVRFRQSLRLQQLKWLMMSEEAHCLEDWSDRFVECFEQNAEFDLWLSRLHWINLTTPDLTPAATERLAGFIANDRSPSESSNLGLRYLQLRQQSKERGFEYDDAFDAKVRELMRDICTRMMETDEAQAFQRRDVSVGHVGPWQFQESTERNRLGNLTDYVMWLVPDLEKKRAIHTPLLFELIEGDVVQSHMIQQVIAPRHYKYVASDRELVAQTLALVKERRLGLSKERHQALVRALEGRARRVAKPWSIQERGHHLSHLETPWREATAVALPEIADDHVTFAAAQIAGEKVFVVRSWYQDRIYHWELAEVARDATARRIGRFSVTREQYQANLAQWNPTSDRPLPLRRYFGRTLRDHLIIVGKDNVFVKTHAGGILVFPLSAGGSPYQIDASWGLSSNYVQEVVPVGNRLFVWAGEENSQGTCYEVELDSRRVKTLASFTRKEAKTPLDNLPRAKCGMMLATPDERRVIMVIDDAYEDSETNQWSQRNGVWQYDLETESFLRFKTDGFQGGAYYRTGQYTFAIGRYNTITREKRWRIFDLESGQHQELGLVPVTRAKPIAFSDSSVWWKQHLQRTVHRQDRETKSIQTFKIIPEGDSNHVHLDFFPDGRSAMICTDERLWITQVRE